MKYLSTRDKTLRLDAAEAILTGLSRDGGLLTPESIPEIGEVFLRELAGLSYEERAARVMALYLTDYTEEELLGFAKNAYGPAKFDTPAVAPVRKLDDATHCLELWHGPTSAFKDMALQMLPQLLSAALRKRGEGKTACILVATSGDTGKAAMEGFADVPQTKILVFYPKDGVSQVQEAQMVTQEGQNVGVCAVVGNFDDAQAGVKRIFSDAAMRETLNGRGYFLSSANSINWGRILPQVVYYISAYCDLLNAGEIRMGQRVNFCVPTGNFGDILAAYYAKRMGLPVGKLICASNRNDVLTDFLRTGVYDRNRPFHCTMSPSMDILVSSNLERLLFDLSGRTTPRSGSTWRSLRGTGATRCRTPSRQPSGSSTGAAAAARRRRPAPSGSTTGRRATSLTPTQRWPPRSWSSTGRRPGTGPSPCSSPPPRPISSAPPCSPPSGWSPRATAWSFWSSSTRSPA